MASSESFQTRCVGSCIFSDEELDFMRPPVGGFAQQLLDQRAHHLAKKGNEATFHAPKSEAARTYL